MAITQNDPITASDVVAALNEKANSSHTHAKSDITDFPAIPTKTSQLTNDSGFTTGTIPTKTSQLTNDSGFLTGLPSHNHDGRYYTESEIKKNTLYNIVNENTKVVEIMDSSTITLPDCNNDFDYHFFNCFFTYKNYGTNFVKLTSMEYKEI